MLLRSRYALIGVLVVLLAGLFVWRYGDSTAPPRESDADSVKAGWHRADSALPEASDTLPGIDGAASGIPRHGKYLVNLWASFCGPCKREMPWLERLSQDEDVRVIGVTRDNLLREAQKAIKARQVTYPNVRDELGDFQESIGSVVPPRFLPSTVLVVDGRITWAHAGPFKSYRDLRDSVLHRL